MKFDGDAESIRKVGLEVHPILKWKERKKAENGWKPFPIVNDKLGEIKGKMSDPLVAIGSLDRCECLTQVSVTLKINGKKISFTLKNNIRYDITKVIILLF